MTFFPQEEHAIVSKRDQLSIISRLKDRTNLQKKHDPNPIYLFKGRIASASFSISGNVNYPNNFLPQIKGKMIPSTKGTLIQVRYQLFLNTRLFLLFISVLLVFLSLFFLLRRELNMALISSLALLLQFVFIHLYFRKQVAFYHKLFIETIN